MNRASRFSLVLAGCLLAPMTARSAGKPQCRDLTFSGAAGLASNDIVTLQVTDSAGNPVERSCQLQVQASEPARTFAARLVAAWGDGGGGTVGACPNPNPPAPLPTRTCGNQPLGTRSCKHKFKFKPDNTTIDPNDGLIRVRICCKDAVDCKGPNLTITPVSVQSKKAPAVVFSPTVPPVVGVQVTGLSIDPIDMTQLPSGDSVGCRKDLGAVVVGFAKHLIDDLVKQLPTDPGDIQKIRDTTAKCSASGAQPSSLGLGSCPPPCNGIQISTCTLGTVGAPCTVDTDCGTGGKCTGDWNLVADCLLCQIDGALQPAYDAVHGAGPDATPEAQTCQTTIEREFAHLIGTEMNETVKCQKLVDAGSKSLPTNSAGQCENGACTVQPCACTAPPLKIGSHCATDGDCSVPAVCKRTDLTGARATSEASLEAHIQADPACNDTVIADDLDTCDVTQAGVIACATAEAQQASRAVADAVFPEERASP